MDKSDWLAERFQAHRPHLRAVAYRLLGSASEQSCPDERERSVAERERAADDRDRIADERDRVVDERDRTAGHPD